MALFDQLQRYLIDEFSRGRRSVLIIDEAQNLAVSTLEELRMLSNINADKDQLLQLVLVGQPQLKSLLRRPELEQFVQRVSSDFHVEPLSHTEVTQYVRHRLSVVGRESPLFDDRAMYVITKVSGGIPRKVNVLCDTALVYGFSQGAERITGELVIEVLRDKAKYGVFPAGREDAVADRDSSEEERSNLAGDEWEHDGTPSNAAGGAAADAGNMAGFSADDLCFAGEGEDPLFAEAVRIVRESGYSSVSDVQRRLNIHLNRAVRLVKEMERVGVVSAADEHGIREVLEPDLSNKLA